MKDPLEFAINLCYRAGDLLKERFNSGQSKAHRKIDNSIVTESDLLADNFIHNSIRKEFPSDFILSEELHSKLDKNNDLIWIVDPLDGTTNYSLGLRYWGISIARVKGKEIQCAAVYFPLLDELYTAKYKHGAYLNSKRIHTNGPNPEKPAAFFSCCSRTFRRYHVNIPYKTRILGSAAYTFCAVANGIAVLGFEATPKIWDIAAGYLIVREAGGYIETLNKEDLFPLAQNVDYNEVNFPTLVAATSELLKKSHKQITPK